MEDLGIILVHGYSGRPEDLAPISRLLGAKYGEDAVHAVQLPGHGEEGSVPHFDADAFGKCIDKGVERFLDENRRIVLIGHSTGGIMVLDHILRKQTVPALLILAGTPARIRGDDLNRWERHREGGGDIPLPHVARLVSCINRVGAAAIATSFPVLVLQGGADSLVRPSQAEIWCQDRFAGPVRSIAIPTGGHNLFSGSGSNVALDCILRALADIDAKAQTRKDERADMDALQAMDKEADRFICAKPQSGLNLLRSPAARRAMNHPFHFLPVADIDPIQLNIEITSRCNLSCGHCARSIQRQSGKDMDQEAFKYILDLMPNTFKVVFVGLGEPTLHPKLVEFVALATRRGHLAGLVTNGMCLDKGMCRGLLAAGLCSLAVSIDSADPEIISQVRPGSDAGRIIGNIRHFMEYSEGKIPTAVFTAVSSQTVDGLRRLAQMVVGLGVNAWMLSDLNFQWNVSKTVWKNWTREHREAIGGAIRLAFSHSLPVLSVRAIEALGLAHRYTEFLMRAPAGLGERSKAHRWCLSPWQTLPVNVEGFAMVCDCRPNAALGSLFDQSFSEIWNGQIMQAHRRLMRAEAPPMDCLICPRF